jgi:hypothetical protein
MYIILTSFLRNLSMIIMTENGGNNAEVPHHRSRGYYPEDFL